MEENGLIQCALCEFSFLVITSTHLKTHGYSMADYLEEFGLPVQSEEFIESRIAPLRNVPQSPHSNDLRSIAMSKWWETPQGLEHKKRVHLNFRGG